MIYKECEIMTTKTNKYLKIIFVIIFFGFISPIKVDGFVPVTYKCCNDYSYDNGSLLENFEYKGPGFQIDSFESKGVTGIQLDNFEDKGVQLDNFENLNNWSLGGEGYQEVDIVNFKEGQQGLKLTAINGNITETDKVINNNFSNVTNFAIWIYVYDINTFLESDIYLTSSGTSWNKYFSKSISGLSQGWNKVVVDKNSFANNNGEDWNNVMNRIRIAIYPKSGKNTSVTLDDLKYEIEYDWIGSTQESDTVNFKEGQQGLKLTATNGNVAETYKIINNNFSNISNFAIWIYVYDINTFLEADIYLTSTSTGTWAKYFSKSISGLKQGWNKVVLQKNSFANNNGDNWDNTMNRIKLAIYSKPGMSSSTTLDDLRYGIENDWIGSSQEPDTVNFKEGQQGLKLMTNEFSDICTNGGISYRCTYSDKIINNNFSNVTFFSIWLYVYDIQTFLEGDIYITSTGNSWSKYFSKSLQNLKQGWNKILIDKSNFKSNNNESWNNTMNMIRIQLYSVDNNSSTNASFDDLRYFLVNDWVGISQEADIVNFKEGQQGLKLKAPNGSEAQTELILDNKDFSNINNFAFWAYIDDVNNVQFIRLIMTSTGGNWSKYLFDSIGHEVRPGWNKLVFNKHAFKNHFNESWNNINRIRFSIGAKPGKDLNITFDDLRTNLTGKRAKIFIEFDDGLYTTYSDAYPILKANGQNATTFVVPSYVGQTNYQNLDQLKILQADGWDISSHTYNHVYLSRMNDSQLIFQLNGTYDWLINNQFQKTAGAIAYPFGDFNEYALTYVEKRYVLGRSTQWEGAMPHFVEDKSIHYVQRQIPVTNVTTVQFIKDNINDTINAKLAGNAVFHGVVNNNPGLYDILKTDFKEVSDYIKSRSADVDVITISEYLIPNIRDYTPVLNKITRIYSNGTAELITKNKYDEYMPNMTIDPSSNSIDINITSYNETGGLVKFNESSTNSDIRASYIIGDRIPGGVYSVKIYWNNGTKYQDFNVISNNTGHIKYNSSGFGSPRYQEISPTGGFNLSGYVFTNNGSELGGVLVQNGSLQNITMNNGSYLIKGLSNGVYNFSYSKEGYNTGYLEIRINGTDNKSANMTIYDITPPVITLNGSNIEIIDINSTYIDAGAAAFDVADGDITARIITYNPVNTSISGIYNVTYNVADYAGNNATQVIRTVNVLPMSTYSSFNIIFNVKIS